MLSLYLETKRAACSSAFAIPGSERQSQADPGARCSPVSWDYLANSRPIRPGLKDQSVWRLRNENHFWHLASTGVCMHVTCTHKNTNVHTHHYATHQDTHWGLSRDETQALVFSCLQKPYVIWPQLLSQKPGLVYTNVDPQHISSPILIIVSNWKTAFNLAKKGLLFTKRSFSQSRLRYFCSWS